MTEVRLGATRRGKDLVIAGNPAILAGCSLDPPSSASTTLTRCHRDAVRSEIQRRDVVRRRTVFLRPGKQSN